MSYPMKTQVLVVGAGPTGMACALTLSSFGVHVTIVDALPCIAYGSRACLVHARTLEELDTVGLAKPLMELGIQSKGVTFYAEANKLIEVDITVLRDQTRFPVALLLPQHEIERVLQEKLAAEGISILRNRTVVGMKEWYSDHGLEVTLEGGGIICAHYVVGADGARSTIRRLAGISFEDPHTRIPYDSNVFPALSLQIVLSDILFEEPLPLSIRRDTVSWYMNKRLLLCPLPFRNPDGSHPANKSLSLWRVGMVIPFGTVPPPPRHPDIEYLQREINGRVPWQTKVTISSVTTSSTYRIRSAVAETFFKKIGGGNVLLLGDAAHVHPPSGGQGMNLGLCDAVVLGRAIKSHIDGNITSNNPMQAVDSSLTQYATSRRKTALKVMGMVNRLTSIINSATGWRRIFRNAMLWVAGSLPFVRRLAAWRLSGLIHRDDCHRGISS